MIKVGISGALGKMGQEIIRAVRADADLEFVIGIDSTSAKINDRSFDFDLVSALTLIDPKDIDVLVDFTTASAIKSTMDFCSNNSINLVMGTSGVTADDLKIAERLFSNEDSPNAVIASNFAIGAVLMMNFAKFAAPYFENAEIIEYHHNQKIDAPSGTAVTTAERMDIARKKLKLDSFPTDSTQKHVLKGSRGGLGAANIPIHSVRVQGVVANQDVILGAQGQTLIIKHETIDRSAFMPGVILAIKKVMQTNGLTFGLEKFLGIDY